MQIVPKSDPFRQTQQFLKRFPDQSGILYCTARRQVDELAARLAAAGYSVRPYHAGLSDDERGCNQELFIRDDIQIMVATIAFGMGMNKPNIRFVLHHDLPMNIESYYQQIGRAGRDGLPAHCLLLFSYGDIQKIRFFISQKTEPEQRVATIHLNALIGFIETEDCRRGPLLRYFGETPAASSCGACDNCARGKKAPDDLTIPVQQFLSCVRRTGERFGAGHVIDVLRGSQGQRLVQFGHDRLSTYGIGPELSKKEWFSLSRLCLRKGLLAQDPEHGGLRLTPEAWEVMRGRQSVAGRLREERRDYDEGLFSALRLLRKELADALKIPPYAVFPDRTLMEMAASLPQNEEGLLRLHGVGRVKLDRFGRDFLETIREYGALHGTGQAVPTAPAPAPQKRPASGRARRPRHLEIAVRFNQGTSVARLAEEYQVKETTILAHLHKALVQGFSLEKHGPLPELSHLSTAQQAAVDEAFERLGTERLGPLFTALNQEVGYDDLALLRLRYLLGK